ncbi:MAG TPA: beta-ketoacyl-ACP synthase III [Pyrinomonadaceae bacterium]|nr:beta-ketoacyl-ACP synthase III [Pyrinomonadaceae bacterium]
MSNVRAGILGTGHSYPSGILTNADLEKIVDTTDEWITTRTGIKQRRKAAPGEFTSQFAARASQEAIERAGIDPADIDLILCATVTPDQILPSTACLIQAQLGASKAAAMDIVAACSGFVYGLTIAEPMIRSGQIKYALVIGAELLTRYVDYTDRGTCVLFGDGAGAAILGPVEGDRGILASKIRSDGRYEEQLYAPGGGTKGGFSAETIARGDHFFKMKGNEVFKIAVRSMSDISKQVLCEAGLTTEDVSLFIPHQANQRITEAVANMLKVDPALVYSNISQHGNTSSASIPICLDECVQAGRIKKDDIVLLASFGGGFTWGGVVMRW